MTESERGFTLPKYGVLVSIRHRDKKINDLINAIAAKFADSICWRGVGCHYFERKSGCTIWFKLHGNTFVKFLELFSSDIGVLREIKQSFPGDFTAEVETKEGLL